MKLQRESKYKGQHVPDTIPCDEEFRCPRTGGVSRCEPLLEGIGYTEPISAYYSHKCGKGVELIEVVDLISPT